MTVPTCPEVVGHDAVGIINDGWVFHRDLITQSFEIANNLINQLVTIDQDPLNFAITLNVPTNLLKPFVAPPVPIDPMLHFDTGAFQPAGDPPPTGIDDNLDFKPIPDFTDTPRGPIDKYKPADFTTPDPTISFTPTPVTYPDDLSITNPTEPDLFAIVLPTLDPIVIPLFKGIAPEVDFTVPTGNLDFAARQYSSDLLDQTRTKLSGMMVGGTGIPPNIEAILFARAMSDQDIIARKAVMEAKEDCGSMGHSLPSGALQYKLMETRQNNANNVSKARGDIYIKLIDAEVQNAKFCVQQGIALETVLMENDYKIQELTFQTEKAKLDASVTIFNSQVQLFNARGQLYGIEAQVFKDLIDAEMLKLETYKAQIDAQRLIGEVNKDLIALYEAQLRANTTLIEQYKARWDAIKTITERDNLLLEQQRLKLQLFDSQLNAWSKKWDVVIKQYGVDEANGKLFESQVNAYAALVGGIAAGNKNLIDEKGLVLRGQELQLQGWRGLLDRFIAQVDAEAKRISAGAQVYDGQARVYAASGEIARNQTESTTNAVRVILEGMRAQAEISVEQLKLQVQQVIQLFQGKIEAIKGAAATAGQMLAGAAAGMSFSAHAQDSNSISQNISCATEYRLEGSLDS